MTRPLARPSPNHGARRGGAAIDTLVIHYTGMTTAAAALDHLCGRASRVSAHYLIDEAGTVFQLVDEARRAWHAGVSFWRGATDINSRSIGIELVNPGHDFGYRDFPAAQIAALIALAGEIKTRHPIAERNVVGHSDIAPARKRDPGERFPWARLAGAGVGLWPGDTTKAIETAEIAPALAAIGYGPADVPLVTLVTAFQRHFWPQRIDGTADDECCRQAAALAAMVDADAKPA